MKEIFYSGGNVRYQLITICGFIGSITVSQLAAEQSCAKAKIEGQAENCSDLRVQFDLSNCAGATQKSVVTSPKCSDGGAVASVKAGQYEYIAQINKSEQWGKAKWDIQSVAKAGSEKLNAKPKKETKAEVKNEAVSSSSSESALPTVGGFIDVQYQWKKKTKSPGFLIYDGALSLTKTFGKLEFLVDLPFAWAGLVDTDGDGIGDTNNNDFKFGKTKAQAFLKYTFDCGSFIQAGQFDTIYGFELNDSKDLAMTTQGLVYNEAIPVTHLGLMTGYNLNLNINGVDAGVLAVKALVGNPKNQGSLDGSNLEYGAQLAYTHSMARFSAGYLGTNQPGPAGMSNLYELMAGVTWGILAVDTEIDFKKVGAADTGIGLLAIAVLSPTDALSVGVRGEWIKQLTNHHALQLTTGPQWKFSDHLKAKADYTVARTQATSGASKVTSHAINVSGILTF